jgi:glycerol dehydrogenase
MANPLEIFSDRMTVFGAPGRYVQGQGVLDRVGPCAAELGPTALLLSDRVVLGMLEPRVRQSCKDAGVDLRLLGFDGKLGPATAEALVAQIDRGWQPASVIAAGGGRAIDAGKALAHWIGCALITLPTVASTDAPTSKNYVLYDDDGMLVEVCHLSRNPDFVIVDTQILAGAPKHMFAAGLGDALSKGAEAEACAAGRGTNMFLARPTRLGAVIAQACQDTLIRHGSRAFDMAGTGQVTEDFDAAVEAMILMAGLGFENGGLSVPHALTRGLPLVPGGAKAQHGFQVAYGLVVHHALLGEDLPEEMVRLYRHSGLPMSLYELTGHPVSTEQIGRVVEATMPVRHMLNFPRDLTARQLSEAMEAVEAAAA